MTNPTICKDLVKQIQVLVGKDKTNYNKVIEFLKHNGFSTFSQITGNEHYLEGLLKYLKNDYSVEYSETPEIMKELKPIPWDEPKEKDILQDIKQELDKSKSVNQQLAQQIHDLTKEKQSLVQETTILNEHIIKATEEITLLKSQQSREIVLRDGNETRKINLENGAELYHKQFPKLLRLLASRNEQGWTEFILLYGSPGAGKTTLYMQLAKALGVTPYHIALGPSAKEGKILGFNNQALGQFIAGLAYEPYKNGGLACFDEIFNCDASVLVALNSLDNEEYRFGNGELVKRHKDFYLIANDNTNGMGSRDGYIRNKADAATLDRFTQFKLELDEELELKISGDNKTWTTYVQKCRRFIESNSNASIFITPRTTRKGAAYLKNGLTPQETCELLILNKLPATLREQLIQQVGYYKTL